VMTMSGAVDPVTTIRTAVVADLPQLERVFRAASLSNPADAPLLLVHPELLDFLGEGLAEGRTRLVEHRTVDGAGEVVGFATVMVTDGAGELEDLFVDPRWHRCGVARRLVDDAVEALRRSGRHRLSVVGNPQALPFYRAVGFIGGDVVATDFGVGLRMHLAVY